MDACAVLEPLEAGLRWPAMSDTSMTREMVRVCEAFGWGLGELRWLTVNAMKSAFIPFDERLALINDVIKPAYLSRSA